MKQKILFLLLCFCGVLNAQVELRVLSDEEVKKYNQIVEEKGDSSLMRAYQLAIHHKRQMNFEQYKKYCLLIIDRTKDDPTNYFSLRALRAVSIVYLQTDITDSMRHYTDRLIEVTENVEDPKLLRFCGMAYNIKSSAHRNNYDYEKAYPLLRKAMEIGEKVEQPSDYLNAALFVCDIIYDSEPYKLPEFVEEVEKTVANFKNPPDDGYIFKKIKQYRYSFFLENDSYLSSEERTQALELNRDLIKYFRETGRKEDEIFETIDMLELFQEDLGLDSALHYASIVYDFSKNSEYEEMRKNGNHSYATALYNKGFYQKAIPIFKELIPMCGIKESSAPVSTDERLEGDYEMLASVYFYLSNIYIRLGEKTIAGEYLQKLYTISNEKESQSVGNAVSDLEVKYDTEKKEIENQALLAENEMIGSRFRYSLGIGFLLLSLLGAGGALYLRLQKTKEELERINDSKNQLFAIVAHDLKGPVSSFSDLSFNVSHLIKNKKYDRLLDLAEYYEKAGRRINYILVNLLDWAISQKDQFVHRPQNLDVKAEVNKVIEELNSSIAQKKVKIENRVVPDALIFFDKAAFKVIIRNLLHNAVKFSHEDSSVIIDYDEYGLKIKDTGIGMDASTIQKIMKKQRVESHMGTNAEKGNGIGLSTCVKLAEQNSAELQIESNLGKGSVFTLKI